MSSVHKLASEIDFGEAEAKVSKIDRMIEHKKRLRIKEEKRLKMLEQRKLNIDKGFVLPMINIMPDQPKSSANSKAPTPSLEQMANQRFSQGLKSPIIKNQDQMVTPNELIVAAKRVYQYQEKLQKAKEKEANQTKLRNQRVEAKLAQHTLQKTRRSLPAANVSMEHLDNLMYIVEKNERAFKGYLGSRVNNPELEFSMSEVKRKA